jgi:hypothetical protein
MRLRAKSVTLLIRIFQTALIHRLTTSLVEPLRSAEYQDSHGRPSAVARMERSAIRGNRIRGCGSPDFAPLDPGYDPLRCPTGKTRKRQVNHQS